MKSNLFKTKAFWLSTVVCLLPILVSLVFYDKMPDMVATHFDFNSQPDGYSPKWLAAFGIPFFMMLMNTFTWFVMEADPKKKGINKTLKNIIRWFIPFLSVLVQSITITYSLNEEINLVRFVPLIIGLIFVLIGNYLPKCRQNYTMGIKLPWTLSSEENWNRTHRMAGKLWIIGGFVMLLYTFFDMNVVVFIGVILMVTVIPTIYSYMQYRRGI